MATIDSKWMIDKLIANNGFWPNEPGDDGTPDPQVVKIVEYTNYEGRATWGVVYPGDRDHGRYERPTEYVRNPRVIWKRPVI